MLIYTTTGGPGFVFNLGGGPGVRVHQFGGGRPRARPTGGNQREEPQSLLNMITSLLPLLLLFVFPLLNAIFSGTTPSGPQVRFDSPISPFTKAHTSHSLGVKYFVNPAEVTDYSARQWSGLDQVAEKRYMHHLNAQCDAEQQQRARMMQDAQGWFFTDTEMLDKAARLPMARCKEFTKLTRKQGGLGW
jgi:DnaJ family protein B protein 12